MVKEFIIQCPDWRTKEQIIFALQSNGFSDFVIEIKKEIKNE